MRKLLPHAVLVIAAAVGVITIATAAAPDPVVGTWQLNPSKSKFTSGPVIKDQTRTYSQSGPTITLVMKTMGPDGKERVTKTTYQLDGKDFPVTGNPDYDTLSGEQVDSNTAKFNLKKGGKTVGETTRTVSKDGKTLTTKQKVTNSKGEKSEGVMVFDKQ